ncbi:MAG: hypothetical protein JWO94_549 [Verrucomicrobiaceae bacterium]|nr:hypothetical protein [Verrucomicrobiaceae bacterium]
MSRPPDLDWLAPFLSKLRCPNTHEALRLASPEEKLRFGAAGELPALINAGGTHLYPVVQGIPHLLPGSALVAS